jgi:hypothetical protein
MSPFIVCCAAEDKLQGQQFLRLSDVAADDPGPKAVFMIFGFPGMWSKSTGEDDEPMSVKPLELTTYAYVGDTQRLTDYDPRLHLLLAATPQYVTARDGTPIRFRDRFGQEARFPIALKGVSGCSVCRRRGSARWSLPPRTRPARSSASPSVN